MTVDNTGWWFQPLCKIWKSVGMIIPNIWKNKIHVPNHSKPPTRHGIYPLVNVYSLRTGKIHHAISSVNQRFLWASDIIRLWFTNLSGENIPCSYPIHSRYHHNIQFVRRVTNYQAGYPMDGPWDHPSEYPMNVPSGLWLCQNNYWKWPSRNSGFTYWNGDFPYSYVSLPEGIPYVSHEDPSPEIPRFLVKSQMISRW